MRPHKPIARCVVFLALALPSVLFAVAGDNPVFNCSFEQVDEKTGVPLGWTPWATDNLAVYTLATAHSGVAAALLTNPRVNSSQGLRCQRVPVTPGKTYEANAWVKITDLQQGGYSLYLEYWTGPQRVQDVSVTCSKVGEWSPLKVRAPVPPGATEASVIVYGSSGTVGAAYFDDVDITAVP